MKCQAVQEWRTAVWVYVLTRWTAKSLKLFNLLPPYGRGLQLPECCSYFLSPWIYFPNCGSLFFLPRNWTFWGHDKNQASSAFLPGWQLQKFASMPHVLVKKPSRWQFVRAGLWFTVVTAILIFKIRICRYPDSSVLCSDHCLYLRFHLFLQGLFLKTLTFPRNWEEW